MKPKALFIVMALCGTLTAGAQSGRMVDITVGDSLTLGNCSNEKVGFVNIDLIQKTRWSDSTKTYNYETGDGFYDYFMGEGDFDTRRLPCKYAGRRFRIATIQQFNNEDGSTRTVLLGQIDNDRTILWIEINKAVDDKEVIFQ